MSAPSAWPGGGGRAPGGGARPPLRQTRRAAAYYTNSGGGAVRLHAGTAAPPRALPLRENAGLFGLQRALDPASHHPSHRAPEPWAGGQPQTVAQKRPTVLGGAVRLVQRIGSGTYGDVWLGTRHCGKEVAVKMMKPDPESDGIAASALREVGALRQLGSPSPHPNIVELFDVGFEGKRVVMVFERALMDASKMLKEQRDRRGGPMPEPEVRHFMRQMLCGVAECHFRGIIHRDLKPDNLLIFPDQTLKLCDFGLARQLHAALPEFTHEVVTLWYRAPEVLLGAKLYDEAVDLWSTGCIAGEFASGFPMFPGDGTEIGQLYEYFQKLGTPSVAHWSGVDSLPEFQGGDGGWPRFRPRPIRDVLRHACGAVGYPIAPPSDAVVAMVQGLLEYDPRQRSPARRALDAPFFAAAPPPADAPASCTPPSAAVSAALVTPPNQQLPPACTRPGAPRPSMLQPAGAAGRAPMPPAAPPVRMP